MARYDNRILVHVKPIATGTIRYGFQTSIEDRYRTELGHVLIREGDAYPQGLVIGANAPKPPRASKKVASGTKSSYCSFDRIRAARAAGWQIGRTRSRTARRTARSAVYYLTVRGVKYAWNLPTSTATRMSNALSQLGIRQATANDVDLVYGSSFPKPPRVSVEVGSGDSINIYSTFCDPSRLDSLPSGYTVISDGYYR